MGKKKIPKTIKFGKQEFSLFKGTNVFEKGQSKEKSQRDAKIIRTQGFFVRTKKVGDKHFLYIREKKKKGVKTSKKKTN